MKFALIADTFPPLRSSGAIQIRDLSREFARQGHDLTVFIPSSEINKPWIVEEQDGFRVMRLWAPRTKGGGYIRRTMGELLMPLFMINALRKSPLAKTQWRGVVWYSPSIFLGLFASWLKRSSRCKGYLIIRDIFPEWAVDLGIMRRGILYWFFNKIAGYQYAVADVIGAQSFGNLIYFRRWKQKPHHSIEVLQNWLGKPVRGKRCSIRISETALAGRKVMVYSGNMGIAQGSKILINLAARFKNRPDVGFIFVGRGSDFNALKGSAQRLQLNNVLFFDEIDPDEISDLYGQCVLGLVTLSPLHTTHNIPGKFLGYMQNGLPVLACLNIGNDLASLIRNQQVGRVCESNKLDELVKLAEELLDQLEIDADLSKRCRKLFENEFSVERAVFQIVAALSSR